MYAGEENSTLTVRIPRYYFTCGEEVNEDNHSLEGICRRRQLWGTEIFTDDSDVVTAAVHSGWLKCKFGEFNSDLRKVCDNGPKHSNGAGAPLTLVERPSKPVKVFNSYGAHITILILPPLESYASINQNHVTSREWKKKHDGMS
ncbi:Rxt3-domain-containing protein [Pyrenophora teres f. maculata]|nr:Rxt3-domain-containing protein [Pyrenophora teres f. maculata]